MSKSILDELPVYNNPALKKFVEDKIITVDEYIHRIGSGCNYVPRTYTDCPELRYYTRHFLAVDDIDNYVTFLVYDPYAELFILEAP